MKSRAKSKNKRKSKIKSDRQECPSPTNTSSAARAALELAQNALHESQRLLAGIIQSAMDAIITVDQEQRVVIFNAAAEKMFGCGQREALGQSLERFIPQRFPEGHAAYMGRFSTTGVSSRAMGTLGAIWGVRANGEEFPVDASISQVESAGRKLCTVILRDITERRRAEEARELLATVVESSEDAIISKTLQGTITAWNPAAEKMFGYSLSEVLGKSMVMLIPPDLAGEEADILARIGRGESVRHFETVRMRKDGTRVDISATISPIRDGRGTIVGASKIARDITERLRAEEAVQQSDARRRFALETAKLGDWELDLVTMQATRSFLHDEIFGYDSPPPEWTFEIFLSHVHPDDRERVRQSFQSCVSQRKRWEFECRIHRLDGKMRWLWACGNHYREPSGKALRMFGIVEDITEWKLAEDLFRRAVEASPSGILMVGTAGEILLANAEAERLFGYEAGELIGEPVETLVPGRFRQAHVEHRAGFDATPVQRQMEERPELYGLRKDGIEFPVEIGLNPVQTASGTQTLIAVVDITARKEAERVAAEYTHDLERSNAELEQFAYIAAHDLQEPLRMVASYTELLRERYQGKLDEKADKYIGYAVDGAQRMQRLLNDLLAYSRVGTQAKALQPTDAEAVLTSALMGLQKAVEANQTLIVREKLPMVQADELQLGQVFQNLIGNALKFHGARTPRIRVSAEIIEKMVRFAVADNGIGMEKESSGRIFQMFQRLHTREEYEGSGIGLAIAKKIVERHGGQIWFDSVVGEGTTFYFTVAAAAKEVEVDRTFSRAAGGG